jgi:hypothetical protein
MPGQKWQVIVPEKAERFQWHGSGRRLGDFIDNGAAENMIINLLDPLVEGVEKKFFSKHLYYPPPPKQTFTSAISLTLRQDVPRILFVVG